MSVLVGFKLVYFVVLMDYMVGFGIGWCLRFGFCGFVMRFDLVVTLTFFAFVSLILMVCWFGFGGYIWVVLLTLFACWLLLRVWFL